MCLKHNLDNEVKLGGMVIEKGRDEAHVQVQVRFEESFEGDYG